MLSRVAESMLWMGRYLERSEGLARQVEVTEQLALDVRHPKLSDGDAFFLPIVKAYGMEENLHNSTSYVLDLVYFLLLEKSNPGSVYRNLQNARDNARMVRDQLGTELWEVLNEAFLWSREQASLGATKVNATQVASRINGACLHFRGLVDEILEREEAWCFLKLGMKLERADLTSRVIDLKSFMPTGGDDASKAFEPYVWLTIMRGCGAGSQRGFGSAEADWNRLVETLVFSATFPRSIRHCVGRINEVLHTLSGTQLGVYQNEAERVCGKLLAELDSLAFAGKITGSLHDFVDKVQKSLNEIGTEIQGAYSYTGGKGDNAVFRGQLQSQS
ncbi:MAG: alpha-E domain-containing protein [Verrucomicrobiota bacterium]